MSTTTCPDCKGNGHTYKRKCKECKSIEKSYAWLGFSMIGLNLVG